MSGKKIQKNIVGRKIKIGFAGCGRIFEKHLEAVKKSKSEFEVVAVCDVAEERLETAKVAANCSGFTSFSEMIENSSMDIVALCTPSGLHAEQAIQASNKQIHVITEKPMATTWSDGKRMLQACDSNGVKLFVVKQNRSNAPIQKLKQAIESNMFGRIHMVVVNVFWHRPEAYYQSDSWRGTWEFDGGAFMNQASHYVDLLDWLIGPVESVQAFTGTLARNIEVEDTGAAIVRWRSGAIGSVNVTMLTYPNNFEGSITVIGEKGTAKIGGIAVNKIEHWEFEEKLNDFDFENANYDTDSVYGYGHISYYRNVLQVLRGISEPETDGREGLRSLELLVAIYRAARDGHKIPLPLDY